MKKLLTLALLVVGLSASAQTKVVKDPQGNYKSVSVAKDTARFTGHTFIDSKFKEWPVYISAHNKLFYVKTSKSGNKYKVYIKED